MTAALRDSCGTFEGLQLHQARGESPCSRCLLEEAVRRLEAEGIPSRPSPPYGPVTPWEAAENRRVLAEALKTSPKTAA
jgi:hypothetical protein